jgi:lipopolysaccharide transport system ATP-binding protein
MSDIVLKVEHLYKRYRLGNIDGQAFKEDIVSFWSKLRGLPDPYETYTTSNELAAAKSAEEVKSRYVWSLQDVNFEVKKGEVVGIIGKNGAGKSTLLKILSKTTTPTKGNVKIKGRIASLLEVGTGFHPDLTGRENIYMNGAILGMTRYEITQKLDEIVAFAGIEAFIDTPVKRYSSGMYVRLAFAVAAHLEPDILIVDEVLAVGDADFQKKCIGKMKDVSQGEGRTVLFVSHNILSIKQLCNKGVLLKNGKIEIAGDISNVITEYVKVNIGVSETGEIPLEADRYNTGEAKFTKVMLLDKDGEMIRNLFFRQEFIIEVELQVFEPIPAAMFSVQITNLDRECLAMVVNETKQSQTKLDKGKYKLRLNIPNNLLEGQYSLNLLVCHYPSGSDIDYVEKVYDFSIERLARVGEEDFRWTKHGNFLLDSHFHITPQ